MSFQQLGIGTRNPNKTLDVSGSVHISETVDISDNVLNASYADSD